MSVNVLKLIDDFTKDYPVNVEGLGGTLGLRVSKDADLPDGISGHLKRMDDDKYTISSNKSEHFYRQRFTLAHEIGHFVLHKSIVDKFGGVDDDVMYRSTTRGDIYNSEIALEHEKQANSFAASLLMPERLVRKLVDEGQQSIPLSSLYRAFQVSPSAMKWRLENLGLMSKVDPDK